uniref:MEG-7 n=1 Tax=Trichobilharzia regenti TaxID=157069 RepID=A0AA85J2W0_TRIRE|nr:unnamed protein product [Trichobilharzia regenti]
MDVFLCTVLLAVLLQANLGVYSFSNIPSGGTMHPVAVTTTQQSTPNTSPPVKVESGTSTPKQNKQGGKGKSVSVSLQTPPELYKPQKPHEKTTAFYKLIVRIMERLSHAFDRISNDVEKFKEKLKPYRI